MLSAENISYKIGSKVLLEGLSCQLYPGKLNLILGPNGAGKSTLVKLLSKQLEVHTGRVLYGNSDIYNITVSEIAKMRAVLSQNIDVAFPLKVSEVIMMGRYAHFTGMPAKNDVAACKEAMHFFDVWDMADRNYLTLSGGEKQRVNFARVMAQIWYPVKNSCRYLFLDEPLTFLDVHYQYEFMHKMKDLTKEGDIIIVGVLHDLNLTSKFADHIILLNQSRILTSGTVEEVLTKQHIKEIYKLDPVIHESNGSQYFLFE
jgi:iron complex transport system ATP-binding protein